MPDLKTILEIVKNNEETARKFFEIEKRILTILDFPSLVEVLLAEIRNQFKIPYSWISLIGKSDLAGFIEKLAASEKHKKHLNIVDKKTFEDLTGMRSEPVLVNGDLSRFIPLFPEGRRFPIRSIAIAPIALDGNIIGSMNQGDPSPDRFHPDIDGSLLEQLAVKVSLCLSNVIAHEKVRFLAFHDPLTGLLNRRVMDSVLEREYLRARRYRTSLSLVFLDLDRFKEVNDIQGHGVGDELLKYLAQKLSGFCRKIDIVARFAGDEFLVLLPETNKKSAQLLMERICAHFTDHPLRSGGKSTPVSFSYGVASVEDAGIGDSRTLLKKADEALYEAKKARKAGISIGRDQAKL
ncbi:MAG: GGDEF domain-containing protein [Desulfobacterales bacterium CG23_combo_of_CG06-09_8_20_14_all_52_9]|nr:MAG: GGDEF domain-containing protein [Desulfobacterales bacterium CG23_combo_of_CG06-09_8_20_14_all_52_9]